MPNRPNERESRLDLGVANNNVAHHWYTPRSNNRRGWIDKALGVLPFTDRMIGADVRTHLILTPTDHPDVFQVSGAAELVDKNGNTSRRQAGLRVDLSYVAEERSVFGYRSRLVDHVSLPRPGEPSGRLAVYYTVTGKDGPVFGSSKLKVGLTKNRETGDVEAVITNTSAKVVNVIPLDARERERTPMPPRPEATRFGVGSGRTSERGSNRRLG